MSAAGAPWLYFGVPVPFEHLGLCFRLCSALFYTRAAKRHLSRMVAGASAGDIVIDLGGGTGTLADMAHRTRPALTYVCVDPALGMLRYVRPHALSVAARGENLPFRDRGVAAVLIGDALHHFTDTEKTIDEVQRILRVRGKLFIFDINSESLLGRWVSALEKLFHEPSNFYSPGQLEDLLKRKGFARVSAEKSARYTCEGEKG